jgi:MFS transporter, DHA1 family, solute carrier family 18 (vesicular amine transporter), member 1/2
VGFSIKTRKVVLPLASAIIFVDMIGYGIIIPTLPSFAKMLGASEREVGLLFSCYAIVAILVLLPLGILVDSYGKIRFIVAGMLTLTLSSILFATSGSWSMLMTARVIQVLSASCSWAAALPLAASTTSEAKRGIEMSLVTIAAGAGVALGPLIRGLGTVQTPFYICATLAFILSFFALLYLKETKEMAKRYAGLTKGVVKIVNQRGVQIACTVIAVLYAAFGMFEVLFPLYLSSFSPGRITTGALFRILGALFVITQPLIGR